MTPGQTALLEAVQALLRPEREAVTVVYPANASALHKGAEGLMLSAAVVPTCDGCEQTVVTGTFQGRRVEGYFTGDGCCVEAEFSMQHGCGTWAPPIVDVAVSFRETIDPPALVEQLRSLATEAREERDAGTRRRLRRELTEFLALPVDEREPTGGETEPGIYRNGDQWVAWDYDSGRPGDDTWDTIDVTEADLTEEN